MDCHWLNVNNGFAARSWQKRKRHVKNAPLTMTLEDYLLYEKGLACKKGIFNLKCHPTVTIPMCWNELKKPTRMYSQNVNVQDSFPAVKEKDKCHIANCQLGQKGLCFVFHRQLKHNWPLRSISSWLLWLSLKLHRTSHRNEIFVSGGIIRKMCKTDEKLKRTISNICHIFLILLWLFDFLRETHTHATILALANLNGKSRNSKWSWRQMKNLT